MKKQNVTLLVMLVLVLSAMLGSGSGISGPGGEKPLSRYQIDKSKVLIDGKNLRVCEYLTFPENFTVNPKKPTTEKPLVGKVYKMDQDGGCITPTNPRTEN